MEMPQQDATLDFWEGKGGIHMKVARGTISVALFLPTEVWNQMCELKYSLHPLKLEPLDKVKKALDRVPSEAEAMDKVPKATDGAPNEVEEDNDDGKDEADDG